MRSSGGAIRSQIPFASYLPIATKTPARAARTQPDEIAAHALALKAAHGFSVHKLKGGHFAPDHDIAVMEALAAARCPAIGCGWIECGLVG